MPWMLIRMEQEKCAAAILIIRRVLKKEKKKTVQHAAGKPLLHLHIAHIGNIRKIVENTAQKPPKQGFSQRNKFKDQDDRLPGTLAVLFMWRRGFLISFVVLIKLPTLNKVEKKQKWLRRMGVRLGFIPCSSSIFHHFDPLELLSDAVLVQLILVCPALWRRFTYYFIFKWYENAFIATCLRFSEYCCMDPVGT